MNLSGPRLTKRKGPAYGGFSGERTPLAHAKTCVEVFNAVEFGPKFVGPAVNWHENFACFERDVLNSHRG